MENLKFPLKFAMRILSECDLTLISVLEAFAPSRIPTPPIAAPQTFLHADDVISVLPWIDWYWIGWSCTILCSWMQMRSILCLLKFVTSSDCRWTPFRVLTFNVATLRVYLQLTSLLPLLVWSSASSLPETGFGDKASFASSDSTLAEVAELLGTLSLVLFGASIVVFRLLMCELRAQLLQSIGSWPLGMFSSSALYRWRLLPLIRRRLLPTFTI